MHKNNGVKLIHFKISVVDPGNFINMLKSNTQVAFPIHVTQFYKYEPLINKTEHRPASTEGGSVFHVFKFESI
ncbi:MAG TPA: hypothetical protein DCQ26_18975 [Marinilabiliales bacterium]|nr:MAG: hypothetical protein A2W95_12215 [Bacteroidetes bacterium GWA2_40_14]OFX61340.1 MAG: hypothetical protein A2W84_11025 [Bacteroidetes bacterium GWC2_40_13]OFX73480.1 MAG: hypothetical protein A2W96_11030 [Bacteroidetes bacterium GWD2_40_43]OFX90620.1 MAG: hypothetical protein A2W97_02500 [Bacteroidetes bacterium GWE2_40_63]OFZ23678.1 MAG: hypothetical protein A2437_06475 [Bacteroidetes bacterium RIFOXYC2_FULL_40_12]HAN00683.1 hypothetical protein [Marinilabiliales bacterium]